MNKQNKITQNKIKQEWKIILAEDFNLNVLDFGNIKNVYKFLDQVLAQNMIPKINKPTTRVTRNTNHFITIRL